LGGHGGPESLRVDAQAFEDATADLTSWTTRVRGRLRSAPPAWLRAPGLDAPRECAATGDL